MASSLDNKLNEENRSHFRSKGEQRIATLLNEYGIPFIYEPNIKVLEDGRIRNIRPDFYLPHQDAYIEYYGRVGNDEYDQRIKRKESLYRANGLAVIPVYPWDFCQGWPDNLLSRMTPKQNRYEGASCHPAYRMRRSFQSHHYTR